MGGVDRLKSVVVTGPESTGKTTLTEALALQLNATWIPEYARSYIEKLQRPYQYQDLEIIAQNQIEQEKKYSKIANNGILLMDTWLIVTKIWFEVVYGNSPPWIGEYLASSEIDLFLVCSPDIPWVADPVRENGGEMRKILFDRYCKEIEFYGFPYEIVEGFGDIRFQNALKLLQAHHIG